MQIMSLRLLYDPTAGFQRILTTRRWLWPMVISASVQLITMMWILKRVSVQGYANIMAHQAGAAPAPMLTPEQAIIFQIMFCLLAVATVPMFVLGATFVLRLLLWLRGYGTNVKTLLSICSHANCTTWIVASVASVCVIALSRNYALVDMQSPGSLSPVSFISHDHCYKWLYSLLRAVDLIGIWYCVLLVFGLKAAEPRMSAAAASGFVLTAWLIYAGATLTFMAI